MTHVNVTVLESAPLHHRQQHCITDVELRRVAMQRRSMRAALNCGVKSTTVSVHQGKAVGDGVAELNTLSLLDELIFMDCGSCNRWAITIPVKTTLLDEHVVHLTIRRG